MTDGEPVPRNCGCDGRCTCVILAGSGVTIEGTGRPDNPLVITADGGGGGASGWDAGDVKWTARASAPAGWLVADGAAVSRTTYAALFAAIGTAWGNGDGSTTFNLPDYTGKFVLGSDATHPRGSGGGAEERTLTAAQMPAHDHSISHDHPAVMSGSDTHNHTFPIDYASNTAQDGTGIRVTDVQDQTGGGGSRDTATTTSDTHNHSVDVPSFVGTSGSAGGGQPVSIMPPYGTALPLIKT